MSTIAVVWWCLGRRVHFGSLEPQQASHLFLGSVPKTQRLPELGAALQGRLCCLRGGTTLKTKVREKYPVHSKQTHYSAWNIVTLIHLCATYIISRFSKLLNIDISVKKKHHKLGCNRNCPPLGKSLPQSVQSQQQTERHKTLWPLSAAFFTQ